MFRGTVIAAVVMLFVAEPALCGEAGLPQTGGLFKTQPQVSATLIQYRTPESGWRSPETISPDFPHLGARDCHQYGSAYGYPECPFSARPARPSTENPNARIKPEDAARSLRRQVKPAEKPKVAKQQPETRIDPVALRRTIGQLLVVGFEGRTASDAGVVRTLKALRDGTIAGIIIRRENVENYSQVKELLSSFRKAAGGKVPLLMIEHAGGSDSALAEGNGFNFYAAASSVGRLESPYSAQLLYRDMASELATVGFNMNVGPKAGVCSGTPTAVSASCFGASPSSVAAFTAAFNFGHHEQKMLTALRSSATVESLATNDTPGAMIIRELAKRQPGDALLVEMPAESAIGQLAPASLRPPGFDGAIIVSIATGESLVPLRYNDLIVAALNRGADIVMIAQSKSAPADLPTFAMEAIEKALETGRLTHARVTEAAARVGKLKSRFDTVPSGPNSARIVKAEQ